MRKITVNLGERSYPILIGEGLLDQKGVLDKYITGHKVCVVTNATVADLYLEKIKAQLNDYEVSALIISDGEQYKNIKSYKQILDYLLNEQVDRNSTVIALGGGVVGDLAGFAAASCLRGLNFIQVPTTLLAQVDSSVGGKTGINHQLGKNLIGAFYQPACVVADLNVLETLPKRQFYAGISEVIKYGLIRDAAFFDWIENNVKAIRHLEKIKLTHIVARSCEIKAQVVTEDERESGLRAILNFGHTFGHTIEAGTGYSHWLHGEAISAGMVMALKLSAKMGKISDTTVNRAIDLFVRFDLPSNPPQSMTRLQMKELMRHDKKALNAIIRLVLLNKIGDAYVTADYSRESLDQVIANALPT